MNKEQEFQVDFLEIDHIRQAVKDVAKQLGYNPKRGQYYGRSSFYIGRGVTVLRFRQLVDANIVNRITANVRSQFPEYKFYSGQFHGITVYLRGDSRHDSV